MNFKQLDKLSRNDKLDNHNLFKFKKRRKIQKKKIQLNKIKTGGNSFKDNQVKKKSLL